MTLKSPKTTILTPKLRAPTLRPEQLVRPRLLDVLENTSEYKITLISAPPGYGKTTLLAQWSQSEEARVPCAWISLDEQDDDPVKLWMHIVEALRQIAPQEDFGADVLVTMMTAGQKLVEISLPILINELAELPHHVEVVLDDYHCITEHGTHESVSFFVEHLPDNVHVVLSSRSDPPLPLGRLRARGQMKEIRTEQIAFLKEETASFLDEKMGLNLSPDDCSVLHERTEGWPAGVYLAALSLQNSKDTPSFITSFGGGNRYIVDLLGEEVLANVSEEVREFLFRTSVLRRMNGPLCDAVVGRKGSGKLLRELARSNLFVIPLGDQGEWYRYHALFSDLLLYELRSSRPELVPVLHSRASVWLEDAGFFESAVRHAIAAEDRERVAILVARHWFEYVFSGRGTTVEWWLESLPEGLTTTQDAALALVRAWLYALSGHREESEKSLSLAESIPYEGPLPDRTASVEVGVATVRTVFGLGGVQYTIENARRASARERLEQTSQQSALVSFGLGASLYLAGETLQAQENLEKALEFADDDYPLLRTASLSFLSLVAADEGHLEVAVSLAIEGRTVMAEFGLQETPQASLAPIALGYALGQRGDLTEAQTELENGLSARRRLPGLSPWPTLIGLTALASVRSARGDRGGAREVLAEARATLEPFGDDTGILTELVERQEHELRVRKRRDGALDRELTKRELDVLGLLDGELSTRQIAESLYVAPSTVRTQIKSIYRKLGVSSRGEAVEEAHVRGLI
jgi:LuxR family transcriptional regulator, maltose regulon positive regulatory protein